MIELEISNTRSGIMVEGIVNDVLCYVSLYFKEVTGNKIQRFYGESYGCKLENNDNQWKPSKQRRKYSDQCKIAVEKAEQFVLENGYIIV